jgi:hypothetical protein
LAQQEATVSETELSDFFNSLETFRKGLNPNEEQQLAAMVVLATESEDKATKNVSEDSTPPPSEQEMEAFSTKLNEFHDSLPGNQHQVLDAMVGTAFAKDEPEVQGYSWIWGGWVRNRYDVLEYYAELCNYQGGDLYSFRTAYGGRYRRIGCWVD